MDSMYGKRIVTAVLISASTWAVAQTTGDNVSRYPQRDFGATPLIDQRRADYQASHEHLARAVQLLKQVRAEIRASQRQWALPGFRYDLFDADIDYLITHMQPVLVPEKRRLEYQVLVPDSAYLVPEAEPTSAAARDRDRPVGYLKSGGKSDD